MLTRSRTPASRIGAITQPEGVIVDPDGGYLVRLRGNVWPLEDMRRVADALGVPVATDDGEPVSMADLDEAFPGFAPAWEVHPYVTAVMIVVLLLVGIAIAVQ